MNRILKDDRFVLLLTLVALGLTALFIFEPMVRRIRRELHRREAAEAQAREYEQHLKHYTEELERSNRELEQFASVVSHDLKAPLHQVACYTQLVAKRYQGKLGEDADEFFGYTLDGIQRMKALITDLMELSRVTTQQHPYETMKLEAIVEEVQKDLAVAITEAGATLDVGPLPSVKADKLQLRQLFQNLIDNAIKFRKNEEPITVRIFEERLKEGETQDLCRIVVADNGIGFEPDQGALIFKVFHRLHTREEYEGTGIGLAICKRVVEKHGGTISASSGPGAGTKFIFTLPRAADATANPLSSAA